MTTAATSFMEPKTNHRHVSKFLSYGIVGVLSLAVAYIGSSGPMRLMTNVRCSTVKDGELIEEGYLWDEPLSTFYRPLYSLRQAPLLGTVLDGYWRLFDICR